MNFKYFKIEQFFTGVVLLLSIPIAQAEENISTPQGCFVEIVRHGSPAETAGLKVGDVIIAAGGSSVRSEADLRAAVQVSTGDLPVTVRQMSSTKNVIAHLESETGRGYRLGVLCKDEFSGSKTPDAGSNGRFGIYFGPLFSWMSLRGSFDGNQVLVDPATKSLAAVPKFDDAVGFGGAIGAQGLLSNFNTNLATELDYQQALMNNSFAGGANDGKAVLHEIGLSEKVYFLADRSFQPVLGAGMDISWLNVPNGIFDNGFSIEDETFRGIGWHAGGGLSYHISSEISAEAFLVYHWRRFNSLNGEKIDGALTSDSFEPSLSIRYHFSIGRQENTHSSIQSKV